jgi:hypothetical protein
MLPGAGNVVNHLSTITIKVNTSPSAESGEQGDDAMKNAKSGRGFWDWLMGSGVGSTGSNG